tara:strand:- start:53 stop:907 length:855 start_codon:yes stop_codon:yes gene_type:complete
MKIYIVGISGMLGSKLFNEFIKLKRLIVRGSSRSLPKIFNDDRRNIDLNCDVYNLDLIYKNLKKFNPDIIINCIGVVKQKIKKNINEKEIFYINSIFPHELHKISKSLKSKLIHFSTDCVFDGKRGNYSEKNTPNAKDLYGLSKIIGEVDANNAITLRTSIIGDELNSKKGLFEWFMSQKKNCQGYSNCYFSGFPTLEIFNIILKIIKRKKLSGVYHLSSYKISKYDLLKLIAKIYQKKIKIYKNTNIKIDRSLNSNRFKDLIKYKSPSWEKLILEMYKNNGKK